MSKTKIRKKDSIEVTIKRENKSSKLMNVNYKTKMISFEGNTYFLIPDGVYLREDKRLCCTFLEGISLPISHKNVEKENITREYKDENGNIKEMTITAIKGLKFDSEILDIILNRKLAEQFTTVKSDKIQVIIALFVIVNVVVTIVGIGLQWLPK